MNPKSVWLLVTLLALCAAAAAQSTAVQTTIDLPFNQVVPDPCTLEAVSYTGTVHTVFTVASDANGGTHIIMNANDQNITGVAQSGNNYQMVGTTNSSFNFAATVFPAQIYALVKFNVISAGSPANENVLMGLHTVVNANGTVTASIQDYSNNCK